MFVRCARKEVVLFSLRLGVVASLRSILFPNGEPYPRVELAHFKGASLAGFGKSVDDW
jgi:hypothetical protein